MASAAGQVGSDDAAETGRTGPAPAAQYHGIMERLNSPEGESRVQAAREIRRLTKTSSRHRRQLTGAIEPLIGMLREACLECNESALLALLNLAVKDERNKIKIVDAGALEPLTGFLQSTNKSLQEYATAAVLTLTASAVNKPCIGSAGSIPLLVRILSEGSIQSKMDSVMALYNLSTVLHNLELILSAKPIPALVSLLKSCNKCSKTAEKCSALLESLLGFDEGRTALTNEEGGVLALVEVIEEGSLQSREHAVGGLLSMCESDRCKYREVILKEGAIPGLLELTVQGTPKSQSKARTLLQLLRKSPYRRTDFEPDTLENIVSNIVLHIDGEDRGDKAKKMLAEMVQVSMEQSLRHLQKRALICTPNELPLGSCPSKVPSK